MPRTDLRLLNSLIPGLYSFWRLQWSRRCGGNLVAWVRVAAWEAPWGAAVWGDRWMEAEDPEEGARVQALVQVEAGSSRLLPGSI